MLGTPRLPSWPPRSLGPPPSAPAHLAGEGASSALPAYELQLARFHRAFEPELLALLRGLPLHGAMRVLDVACGDGFYSRRIGERLGPGGSVTGVDINPAFLELARAEARRGRGLARVQFVAASCDRLPFADNSFDLVWCAQSLYSLPDPVLAIRQLARPLRPGGVVAVLENDTLHQVLLPWPVQMELPLRAAELRSFQNLRDERRGGPSRYYVGRRLPAVLAAAGLRPLRMTTHAFDRQAPLAGTERALLQNYLDEVLARVSPYLEDSLLAGLRRLVDPDSSDHLLAEPQLSMTWLSVLALGQKAN